MPYRLRKMIDGAPQWMEDDDPFDDVDEAESAVEAAFDDDDEIQTIQAVEVDEDGQLTNPAPVRTWQRSDFGGDDQDDEEES